MPVTRVCVALTTSDVPVGTHTAWLSDKRSGCPFDVTRTADVMNRAATHGPFAAGGGGSGQPAITYGGVGITVGIPDTVTRGFGAVGCAWPP